MNKRLFKRITEWQRVTFPKSDARAKGYHLKEEVDEVQLAIYRLGVGTATKDDLAEELADCVFLIFGIADKTGISHGDLTRAVESKLAKNRSRAWKAPDENGVVNHEHLDGVLKGLWDRHGYKREKSKQTKLNFND